MRFALCPVPVAPSPNLLLAANDDFVNMNPNVVGVFNVLANDTDPNGDALTVTVVSAPLHGTVIILLSDELQYKPVANYARQDILTYAISDGKGGSATANIVIRITNRSPIALPDIATTFVNAPVIITVLVNDTEPDSQPLSVMGATVPVHGTVLINANGTIRYTPTSGCAGMDAFNHTINDRVGGVSTTSVTVIVVNRVPVAANDVTATFVNTAVTITVLANDSDPDGSSLTVASASVSAHGASVVNANGTITYTPANGYLGADSFTYTSIYTYTYTYTYTITDGAGGTASATASITVGNRNPVAANDTANTVLNTAVIVSVLTNDIDPDAQFISVSSVSLPTHGTAVINANGTVTYTPTTGYLGADTFTYTISDGAGGTAAATVNVAVTALSAAIVADTVATTVNAPITIAVLTNDALPAGVTPTVIILVQSTRGTTIVNANGTVIYTPNNNAVGRTASPMRY